MKAREELALFLHKRTCPLADDDDPGEYDCSTNLDEDDFAEADAVLAWLATKADDDPLILAVWDGSGADICDVLAVLRAFFAALTEEAS